MNLKLLKTGTKALMFPKRATKVAKKLGPRARAKNIRKIGKARSKASAVDAVKPALADDSMLTKLGTGLFAAQLLPFGVAFKGLSMMAKPAARVAGSMIKGGGRAGMTVGEAMVDRGTKYGERMMETVGPGRMKMPRAVWAGAGAGTGLALGLATRAGGRYAADRVDKKRDPANTMGLNQSLHGRYR